MPLGLRITLIVGGCVLAGAALGWLTGRWFGRRGAWGLGLAGVALAGWLILSGRAAPGMEGLGLVLLAVLFVLPGTLGAVAAAWLAARGTRSRIPGGTPTPPD